MDDAERVQAGGVSRGLAIDPEVARTAPGLAALSASLRLDAFMEDCLRQVFTSEETGRPDPTLTPCLMPLKFNPEIRSIFA